MTLCANRPEGFGPFSHRYARILTSCFLDTVLVPLCTWLYLFALTIILALARRRRGPTTTSIFGRVGKNTPEDTSNDPPNPRTTRKLHLTSTILYYLLILAQTLMCILEIVRLSLAHLGIGLLPFTFVTLLVAATLRFTSGLEGRLVGWKWATVGVWAALAVVNGVKIAEEVKEGTGTRKGSKYPEADEITDVSVMIGVYVVLGILEIVLPKT
ncbi:MAG: hypothetical protein Q9218_003196 [Villophora microphyllina]